MTNLIKEIIKSSENSIFWIEHKMEAVFNLYERVVVLDYGVKLAGGTPGEIAVNKSVVEAYLGEPHQ